MHRKLTLLLIAAAVVALAAGSATAAPLCSQVGQSSCESACAYIGESCVSWWIGFCNGETAPYTYQCTSSTIEYVCGCSFNCFLAGTEISLADGTTKPVEDIAVGDVVLAYDEASGEMKPDAVKQVHRPTLVDSYLVVNERLHLTSAHPVLSDGAWVEIGDLRVGDSLTAADGGTVTIDSIEEVREPVTVYNFAVNPYGTYVADGIIVHNKPPLP